MNGDPKNYDCWVFPCVDSRAQPVFFTIAAEKGRFCLGEIKDKVIVYLKEKHGLEYVGDGSGWGKAGISEFEFWPPEEGI